MKKILMHICCAPCFVVPYYRLKESYDISGFWYNHNIHPVTEYNSRSRCMKNFVKDEGIRLIDKGEYGLVKFITKYVENEEQKCYYCYFERLDFVAQNAKAENFDYFSTSLLYSKRQNHEMIKDIGFSIAEKYKIDFFYQDFRVYWEEGISISKEKGMYRQKYCGCIFIEMERFLVKENG